MYPTFPGSNKTANLVKLYFEILCHAMYSLMTIMHLPLVSWVCQYD